MGVVELPTLAAKQILIRRRGKAVVGIGYYIKPKNTSMSPTV